jgi:linoleoyl-CoA desaturase
MAFRWQWWGDFEMLVRGRIGPQRIQRPKGRALAGFIAGKLLLVGTAFVVPALARPLWQVLLFYAGTMMLTGFLLAIVFQLAHSVDAAEHPGQTDGRLPAEWAVHQVETTVDFARRNRLLTWYVGGLNYQVEHHLFPRVAHTHYPALARIVEETCAGFGVRYRAYRSFAGVLASHYRFLREMGRPPQPSAA